MVRTATKRKAKTGVAAVDNTDDVKKNAPNGNGIHEKSESPPQPTEAKRKRGKNTAGAAAAATAAAVETESKAAASPPAKKLRKGTALRVRVAPSFRLAEDVLPSGGGVVLTVGQGDTGQLGLGEDVMERSKPGLVKGLEDAVDVAAGAMHSVCLTKRGEVFTFGCNDEGALGRSIADDEEGFNAGKVELPLEKDEKVVQITAGDSHCVALTSRGRAFYWGTFRDSSGSFGLTEKGMERLPIPLCSGLDIRKVSSGTDHVAVLTQDGALFTVGCAEQGQLGRVGDRFVARGGRRGLGLLLNPDRIHAANRRIVFSDVWAGSYSTYAMTTAGDVLVCGLNNYNQLGVAKGLTFYTLVKSESITRLSRESGGIAVIAPGQHHAIVLDKAGHAFALGRAEYGRLGLGEDVNKEVSAPVAVPALSGRQVSDVSCGTAVSFAVDADSGEVFSWGMGTNGQLARADGGEDDAWVPEVMAGKQLDERRVLLASGGGQHTMLLATNK